jgi:transcriptional regulator with XRE-family HTH domain
LTDTVPRWHYLSVTLDQFMRAGEITDQALAVKVGCSRPHITRIRNGDRQPSLPLAVKLANATRLPIATFVREAA